MIAGKMDLTDMRVEASYLLSSSLQARCASALQARSLVNTVRQLAPKINFNGHTIQIYATIQKPKEVREKNGVLLRSAEYLQTNLFEAFGKVENYKCVCWRSSTLVVHNRRIAKITRHDAGNYEVAFQNGWHDPNIFKTPAADMEAAVRNIATA